MLFNSYVFLLLFLPLCYLGHRLLLLHDITRQHVLLWLNICSLFFYAWWNPAYLPLMLISICGNFLIGRLVYTRTGIRSGLTLLIAGITLNLLCLAYFKYTNFLLANLNTLLGTHYYNSDIILPLAISFFTFQQIAYLVDTWHGQGDNYRFREYCLFVIFFPHLLAGPIVHHREIIPQFSMQHSQSERAQHFATAITAISFGLFKKVILADTVAFYANQIFGKVEAGADIGFFDAWVGAISFSLQIYFDFSAYSDIACGLALLFGVRLPQNFASPYRSTSIINFWQSWHMTLSRFLRNYVYIPLGGNRHGLIRRYTNLLCTMLLGGLWHGAGWTFVIWGAIHGVLLAINHGWRHITQKPDGTSILQIPAVLSCLLTYTCVVLSWVMFRADNISSALRLYRAMFSWENLQWTHSLHQPVISDLLRQLSLQVVSPLWKILPLLCLLQLWVWCLPNLPRMMLQYRLTATMALPITQQGWRWQPHWSWSILTSCAFLAALMALYDTGSFIYFQF